MSDLQQALDAIRERSRIGGYTTMQLGGDPAAKVWPAETWKVCESQADLPRLLAAVEAVLKLHRPGQHGIPEIYGDGHYCIECNESAETEPIYEWPCSTVRALTDKLTGDDNE